MGSKKQSSTTSSTNKTENWFLTDTNIKDLFGQAIGNAGNLPTFDTAGFTPEQLEAMKQIAAGRDWGKLGAGAGWLGQTGAGATNAGLGQWQASADRLNQAFGEGGILTQGGYQQAIKDAYNSDLVNEQLEVAGKGIQDQLGKAVQGINQRAAGSGGMGSSRAGVAEGVATGKAADALASATAQIHGNAYQQAANIAAQQAGNALGGIQSGFGAGSNMFGQGGQFVGQGMGWGNTIGQGQMQDYFNKFGVGALQQQFEQGKIDREYLNKLQQATGGLSTLLPIIGGAANWGQTSTGTSTTTGKSGGGFGQFMGGLAGAALGGMTGGLGTAIGSGIGSSFFK